MIKNVLKIRLAETKIALIFVSIKTHVEETASALWQTTLLNVELHLGTQEILKLLAHQCPHQNVSKTKIVHRNMVVSTPSVSLSVKSLALVMPQPSVASLIHCQLEQ